MIIVIGLGSMGKRRIRLLKKIKPDEMIIGVDLNPSRREAVREEFDINTQENLDEVLANLTQEDLNYAFISTSPLSHAKIINSCLKAGVSVFTEINLVDDMYEENIQLAGENGCTLYLSSTGLFRNEMRYLIERVRNSGEPLSYVYHVGQYLPDWHPWESYKDFFIGDKRTNGCREILAIEFPWIVAAFGKITDVKFNKMKQTNLDIDFCDSVMVLVSHENGHMGTFIVDVVCRKAVRDFRVFGENMYITWKGTTDSLMEYDFETKEEKQINMYAESEHIDGYSRLIIENAYESEIMDFFDVAEGRKESEHTFTEDKEILGWIDKIDI